MARMLFPSSSSNSRPQPVRSSVIAWSVVALMVCLGQMGCSNPTPVQPVILSDKFSDIQARLLTPTCAASGCHSGDLAAARLNLEAGRAYNDLLTRPVQNSVAVDKYTALVVPMKPDSSFLCVKLTDPATGEGDRMPQRRNKLAQNEIDAIESWIARGAPND
jgi:hypothetical protein